MALPLCLVPKPTHLVYHHALRVDFAAAAILGCWEESTQRFIEVRFIEVRFSVVVHEQVLQTREGDDRLQLLHPIWSHHRPFPPHPFGTPTPQGVGAPVVTTELKFQIVELPARDEVSG